MEPLFSPILALSLNFNLAAVVALVAGILILIRPALLSYIVAIYLIIVGVLGIIGPI
ncbi:MAG: DUF3096 domain-containing protein [Verrucomicrobiales bacterium]